MLLQEQISIYMLTACTLSIHPLIIALKPMTYVVGYSMYHDVDRYPRCIYAGHMFNTPSHPVPQYQVLCDLIKTYHKTVQDKTDRKEYHKQSWTTRRTSLKPIVKPHVTKSIGKSITTDKTQQNSTTRHNNAQFAQNKA